MEPAALVPTIVADVDAITTPTKLSVETELNASKPLHRSPVATNASPAPVAMPGHGGSEEIAAVKGCAISSVTISTIAVVCYILSTTTLALDFVMGSKQCLINPYPFLTIFFYFYLNNNQQITGLVIDPEMVSTQQAFHPIFLSLARAYISIERRSA